MFDDGGSNVRKYNTVNRRVFILKIAKGIIFTGIVARLFSLQITENKKYLTFFLCIISSTTPPITNRTMAIRKACIAKDGIIAPKSENGL